MSLSGFIDDGYTEQGLIVAAEGLYPAVRFLFRPMLVTELAQYSTRVSQATDEAVRREVARWLSLKLVEWDVRDGQDREVPIRPVGLDPLANLLRLKPPLFVKLWKIICCDLPSDHEVLEDSSAGSHGDQYSKNFSTGWD